MPESASDAFDVGMELRPVPIWPRLLKGAARIAVGLLNPGDDPGGDVSGTNHVVVVRERSTGTVVHEEPWGGDEQGAREALARIQSELAELDPDAFRAAYSIGNRRR